MADDRIEIYNGRLDATEAEIVAFLTRELGKIDLQLPDLGRASDAGFFVRHFSLSKGADLNGKAAHNIQKAWEEDLALKEIGTLYILSFWEGAKWIHFGAHFTSPGPFGLREFYSGHLELTRTYAKKDKPTNVVIVSGWPTLRPYWQWVAESLRRRFKEKRKGGPHETPKEKQIEAVEGWRQVKGTMPQELYCSNFKIPVTPRQLQHWEVSLETEGLIPKRKRR